MIKISKIFIIFFLSINITAGHHESGHDHGKDEISFPGLVSSEIFKLSNGMDLHVERRKTCNQGTVPKHFHPAAGTLVYVLDGKSQSKSTGKWKTYSNNDPSLWRVFFFYFKFN